MYGKLGKRLTRGFGKAHHLAKDLYGGVRRFASAVDQGADLVGRLHSAVGPALQQTDMGRQASRAIKSGMEGYAHAKGGVMAKHREVEDMGSRVRTFAPELSALF
jgi:hypothetical protein